MRPILLAATVLVVAGGTGCGAETHSAQPRHPSKSAASPHWLALPRLTNGAPLNVDGAGITTVANHLLVGVVNRAATEGPSTLFSYEQTKTGWRQGAPPLPVDRDAPVDVLGGARYCVSSTYRSATLVRCLTHGRWHRLGGVVLHARDAGSDGYSGAAVTPLGEVVLSTQREIPSGRFSVVARRLDRHGRWVPVGRGELAPNYARGAQRPYALTSSGRTCVAFDAIPDDPTFGPDIALSCGSGGAWDRVGPKLASHPVVGSVDQPLEPRPIMLTGATGIGPDVDIGVTTRTPTGSTWTIRRLAGGRWVSVPTPGPPPGWSAQGSLFGIEGRLWAIRFDQSTDNASMAALQTRLTVLRVGPRGAMTQVGLPLRSARHFNGPLYYGMASSEGKTFAMVTVPAIRGDQDEVRIFELR